MHARTCICDTHQVHDVTELKQRDVRRRSGMFGDKVSSMTQCTSGTNVSEHVFMSKEGILSVYYDSRAMLMFRSKSMLLR